MIQAVEGLKPQEVEAGGTDAPLFLLSHTSRVGTAQHLLPLHWRLHHWLPSWLPGLGLGPNHPLAFPGSSFSLPTAGPEALQPP